MAQARLKRDPLAVFVNAPFDPAYDPMLEALVFTIFASGYRVRCTSKKATAVTSGSTNWCV